LDKAGFSDAIFDQGFKIGGQIKIISFPLVERFNSLFTLKII